MREQLQEAVDMVDTMLELISDSPTYFEHMAKVYRKFYDELRKQEFSDEQAMQIISTLNFNNGGK